MKRNNKHIDHHANPLAKEEMMIRLLCSPLYYDKTTRIVSAEAFNLRMMGRKKTEPEQFASLGHKEQLEAAGKLEDYYQLGYKVWDDKSWEDNEYAGYGTFRCGDACRVNPQRIEIHPLIGDNKGHIGLFYVKSDEEYFRGPLPMDDDEIVEMLSDLSNMIADTISVPPPREIK